MDKIIKIIRAFLPKNVLSWKNKVRTWCGYNLVENVNAANHNKRCLILYVTEPFHTKVIPDFHQNQWQVKEMARIIGEHGFVVDVAQYDVPDLRLKHNYDLVVGLIPRGLDIYSTHLNPDAIRIAYLTSMNLAVTTANERERLEGVKKRRGAILLPRRGSNIVIEKKIEEFDGAWYIGNEYNFHSYDCFKMPPSFRIINSGYAFNWANTMADRDPKSFVFFASSGQVHKGLDLLLEIFSRQTKDCTLYVCSCYEEEEDFVKEYHKELYETPNIKAMGFLDIRSDTFKNVAMKSSYVIMPSCAEGCAGSVLTAMSAGLIPIVSKECGFEDDEVICLENCEIDTIFNHIKEYSQKSKEWIKENSKRAVEIVKQRYSKECFTKSVEKALAGVLKV